MKRLSIILAAILAIAIGSQAQAALLTDWTFNSTSMGGSQVVSHIDSIGMNGIVDLTQNIADGSGIAKLGDTFTISNATNPADAIAFEAVSYNSGANLFQPFLTDGLLSLQTPQLSGSITNVLGTNVYSFGYNSPGAGAVKLVYTKGANSYTIATFDIDPTMSGGTNFSAPLSGTGLITGSSSLSGVMHILLSGVLFDSMGNDLAGASYTVKLAALSGGYNYGAKNNGTNIAVNNGSTNDNFTIGAVPEPSSFLLLGSGILGAAVLRRRGSKVKAA